MKTPDVSWLPIIDLSAGKTERWTAHTGDVVLWMRCVHPHLPAEQAYTILDLWELQEGDRVVLTSRPEDVPAWLELGPNEYDGDYVLQHQGRWTRPSPFTIPTEAPNIWRACCGDVIVWTGRGHIEITPTAGVLFFARCRCSVLIVGQPSQPNWGSAAAFGRLIKAPQDSAVIERCRNGVTMVQSMGIPRQFSQDWRLGDGEPAPPAKVPPQMVPKEPFGGAESFVVYVDDNFHYMDEDERYEKCRCPTREDAIAACKSIVEECLRNSYKPGMTATELYDQYVGFGDDPWICGEKGTDVPFNAWDYARELAERICGDKITQNATGQ